MKTFVQLLLASSVLLFSSNTIFSQSPSLGTASSFALFTSTGAFINTGVTNITGNIGTNNGALTGFPPGIIVGQTHIADATSAQVVIDANAAFNQLGGIACGVIIGTTLGSGQILTPNVYCLGDASTLNGDLILDGQGDANAIFIFKIDGSLTIGTFSNIVLINSASLCNVYWQINGAFDLADNSFFKGTVIANGAITLEGSSSYYGRAISIAGAISLHNNLVAVMEAPIIPAITGNSTACIGQNTTLSDTTPSGIWSSSNTALATVDSSGVVLGVAVGSPTITYTVTNAGGCIASQSKTIIINNVPTASISGSATICSGTSTNLTVNLTNGSPWSITYTDSTTPVTINGISITPYLINVSPTVNTKYTLTLVTSNGCSASGTYSAVITVLASLPAGYTRSWNGSVSTDWNNASNWCPTTVPTVSDAAYINRAANQPTIFSSAYSVKNIGIDSGAVLTIDSAATLTIKNSILSKGEILGVGSLVFDGTSLDTITGTITIANLTLNNSAGAIISSGSGNTLSVTKVLTVTSGTLATNGNLVLTSNASGTARLAESYGNISGAATVQRYIPGKRAWRFLTAPLSSNGISAVNLSSSWQLNTYIVGPVGIGLDFSSPRYNFQTYNNSSWNDVSDPTTTTLFTNGTTNSNKAFAAFIVGDRTPSNLIIPNFNNTTLSATGKLLQGTQTLNLNALAQDDYAFIGNPYASPIDLDAVYLNASTSNIYRTFYTWDPLIGTGLNTGGYVTISWDGTSSYDIVPPTTAQTRHIQSGQAFFIQATTASAANVSFEENDKSNNSTNTVFGTSNNTTDKLFINLQKNIGTSLVTTDGVLASFGASYSQAVLWNEDAAKFSNNEESITLIRDANWLSIERRPYITGSTDTLFLRINRLTINTAYTLQFQPQNWDAGMQAFLVDNLLFTETPISLYANNTIQFTASSADLNNRFYILFKTGVLINNKLFAQAQTKDRAVEITWNITSEEGVKEYWIEKSFDAKNFQELGVQQAIGKNVYSFIDDATTISGTGFQLYYRIRMINKNTEIKYSNVITLNIKQETSNPIRIYPNPVKRGVIQLQLTNAIAKGNYTARLFDGTGKQIEVMRFVHTGGTATKVLQLSNYSSVETGVYQLVIDGNNSVQILPIYIAN